MFIPFTGFWCCPNGFHTHTHACTHRSQYRVNGTTGSLKNEFRRVCLILNILPTCIQFSAHRVVAAEKLKSRIQIFGLLLSAARKHIVQKNASRQRLCDKTIEVVVVSIYPILTQSFTHSCAHTTFIHSHSHFLWFSSVRHKRFVPLSRSEKRLFSTNLDYQKRNDNNALRSRCSTPPTTTTSEFNVLRNLIYDSFW